MAHRLVKTVTDYTGGHTGHYGIGRHILGHNGSSSHSGTDANGHAAHYHGITTYPGIIADCGARQVIDIVGHILRDPCHAGGIAAQGEDGRGGGIGEGVSSQTDIDIVADGAETPHIGIGEP